MKKVIAIVLVLVLSTAMAVFAKSSFSTVFASNYKLDKNSAYYKNRCVVCHVAKGKKDLNPYGKDVQKAMKGAKELTAEALKAVEKLDSDKDKVSNLDEIKKMTYPGDPKSK